VAAILGCADPLLIPAGADVLWAWCGTFKAPDVQALARVERHRPPDCGWRSDAQGNSPAFRQGPRATLVSDPAGHQAVDGVTRAADVSSHFHPAAHGRSRGHH
jgi:hypothetical protein